MKIMQANASAILSFGFGCLLFCAGAGASEPDSSIPPVLRAGFEFFQKQHPEQGVDVWKEGGLVGEEFKAVSHASYFRQVERTLGKCTGCEWITTKMIGTTSKVIYFAINYERGAVFARFVVYRTAKDWVVQNMSFNTRPEALMPWLAFEENP